MPQVPQFNNNEKLNGASLPYIRANASNEAFGVNVSQAGANIAGAFKDAANAALKIKNTIDDAKLLELSNSIDKWEQDNLYDKENGYYNKNGKDAVGKSADIMKSYDDFVQNYKSKNRVTPNIQARMDSIIERKKTRISAGVNNHDIQQTNNWAKIEGEKAMDNSIIGMVHARNNPDEMAIQLQNGLQAVKWQGLTQNLDEDIIEAMQKDFKSKAHEAVLNSYIQEGSLQAGEYFKLHQNEIHPQAQARFIGAIKNEEMKYQARNIANNIVEIAASEQEAMQKAEAIEDINLSDQVVSRVKKYYSQQDQYKRDAERDSLNLFYSKAVSAAQNGGSISYDDIPDNLDPQTKLSLMNYVNKNGQPETDDQIWETLYEMSVNNAQGFVQEDLNKYRGFLSDGEYKSFLKRQEEIKTGNFYTTIKDDDKKIAAALKIVGLNKNSAMPWSGDKKDIAFSEIKSMTREFEARKGRAITDTELNNIINSLGYKDSDGVQIYKQIERGMREKTGFIKSIMNDFAYYQTKHNGELPPDSEKLKIINYRIANKLQEQNDILVNSLEYRISHTQAKPNETKELTYYADKYIPQLGKELGVKFTIVEGGRYRKPNGKYTSYHSKGEAADVSLSEHSKETKIKFIESQIANPQVKAIGTSDPLILSKFKGNSKIVDETKFDKQHGTNHVNHAHITLNTNIANKMVKMQAPDGRIVNVPQSMVNEALKNGGIKL